MSYSEWREKHPLLSKSTSEGYRETFFQEMLNTPIGKVMMRKATIAEMGKKSGMDADVIISKIKELIFDRQ